MDLKEFKELHPRIKITEGDKRAITEQGIDLYKLHKSIGYSRWLKNAVRLSWLIKNYDEINAGKYDDFPEARKKHFANKNTYTQRELDSIYDDIQSIEF